ncbi:Tn3 family transposase [Streptomyces catenulae]|uniref:Tn3 family transposase n=1 Tax=Streptomyces catenulae TaxID=66875 RepID=UPI000B26179C
MAFHNILDIAEIVRQLQDEDHGIEPEDLAHISPRLTERIRRFGEFSTHTWPEEECGSWPGECPDREYHRDHLDCPP